MINSKKIKKVHFACGVTDMRKSIDGLAIIIQERFKLDPFSEALFVFCNKHKNILKILHWDYNGFWIYTKRLEKGKFKWPESENDTIRADLNELYFFFRGLRNTTREGF